MAINNGPMTPPSAPTQNQHTHHAPSDTVLSMMAGAWGDWAFGEGSRMSQLLADWMSIDGFIVLCGGWVYVWSDGFVCLRPSSVSGGCREGMGTIGWDFLQAISSYLTQHTHMYACTCTYAGAVLTSFIGVDGLLAQMAQDRCVRGTEMKHTIPYNITTVGYMHACNRHIYNIHRCFPQILLRKNKWRKTHHVIILSFLALSLGACDT